MELRIGDSDPCGSRQFPTGDRRNEKRKPTSTINKFTTLKKSLTSVAAFAVALSATQASVTPVHAFIEELLGQLGGGGGGIHFEMGGGMPMGGMPMGGMPGMGGFHQIGRQEIPDDVKFPAAIEDKISKEFNWLRGTEWFWNRKKVKFSKDGTVEMRTEACMTSGQCKWAAYHKHKKSDQEMNDSELAEGRIYIMAGKELTSLKVDLGYGRSWPVGQSNEELDGLEMYGRNEETGKAQRAVFEKVYDHEAFKDYINLYDVLGFSEDLNPEDVEQSAIKKAYRKLSLKYHPDKVGKDPAKQQLYVQITNAYEVLGDPAKRARYDCCGMEGVKGEMQKGRDMEMTISVSLEELYNGNKRTDSVRRRVVCRRCKDNAHSPRCRGCGKCPNETKMVQTQLSPGMIIQQQQEVASKERCKSEATPLKTEIERGMKDGDKINFAHMAEQTPGQLPGDVNVKLSQRDHKRFKRSNNDLHMTMKISLKEALLGFEREIQHLDGHTVELKHSKPTQPFQTFRIDGEGMPHKDDPSQYGNLFVKAEVVMPGQLTSDQKALIQKVFPEKMHKEEL